MRLRVASALALLTLLALLLQALVLILALDKKEDEFIDRQLRQQLAHSMRSWQATPKNAYPNTPDMQLYHLTQGQPGETDVPHHLSQLAPGLQEIFHQGREYHVAVGDQGADRFILVFNAADHDQQRNGLVALVVLAAMGMGGLSLLLGYWLAGRLTRPLEQLAQQMESDTAGPLIPGTQDRELWIMADALARYRIRLQSTLEREQAFAANLAHELRTPLTGIRTDAEMLAELAHDPDAVTRRSQRLITSVDRINDLANSLLALARATTPLPSQPVPLGQTLTEAWQSLQPSAPRTAALHLDIPETHLVLCDPQLLTLVLRNLLDNALRYGGSGDIYCHLSAQVLHVRDSGAGFADQDLERIFDRFFIGERGANGIGLALVRQVCLACGWQVAARNTDTGGEVLLDLGSTLVADKLTLS